MLEVGPLASELVRLDVDRLDRPWKDPKQDDVRPDRAAHAPCHEPQVAAPCRHHCKRRHPNAIAAISQSVGITTCTSTIARAPDGAARRRRAGGSDRGYSQRTPQAPARRGCTRPPDAVAALRRVVEPRPVAEDPEPEREPRLGEQQHERDIEDPMHDRIEQRQPKQVEAEVTAEQRIGDAERPAIEKANGVVPKPGEADRNEERQQDRQRPAEEDRSLEFGEHRVDRGAGRLAPAFHHPQCPTQVEPEREHERARRPPRTARSADRGSARTPRR